jgi:KaiC/GvpD/RAD55 family RecA-like ATPase
MSTSTRTGAELWVDVVTQAVDGDTAARETVCELTDIINWAAVWPAVLRCRPGAEPMLRSMRYGRGQRMNGKAADAGAEYDALLGAHAERLLERKLAPIDAVPTLFPSWTQACRDAGGGQGLPREWHIIVAARTGVGKSVFALNACAEAMRAGARVFFVSLEMSQVQLETRFLAIASGTSVRRLEQGPHLDVDAHRAAARRLHEIHEESGGAFLSNRKQLHSLAQVDATIRRAVEYDGARLIVVDYLQLAASDPNDPKEITTASHAVRRLANDLQVTTLALSQFNRATSVSPERPTVHGLMGGSAIENDSDQILLIDHSRMERAAAPAFGWTGYALLDKNRHGPLTDIPMYFNTDTLRITERMPDEMPSTRVR